MTNKTNYVYSRSMRDQGFAQYFKGKKITVMGIGLLGRGIGDIKYLASQGAQITATDLKSAKQLESSLRQLKKFTHINYTLEKHKVGDFRKRDLIIHTAGIPENNQYLTIARENNIPCLQSFTLLMDILRKEKIEVMVIGVTGTKGKSTTTALIESMLQEGGFTYHIAGNRRGVSNLQILNTIKDGDIILAELSSWEAGDLKKIKWSPDISVFTNFFEDHMNYYKGSMKRYFKDKSMIFKYQTSEDHLILTSNASKALKEYQTKSLTQRAQKHHVRFSHLPKSWNYHIFGSHNEHNLALAYEIGTILGLSRNEIKKALTSFTGIEGRLEYLGKDIKRDLIFYNDNNSTTPESTLASLSALAKKHPRRKLVVIAGGSDKDANYTRLSKYLARQAERLYLFPGEGTDKICRGLPETFLDITQVLDMKTACNLAIREADEKSIIVLSPAAASFGAFNNEYERGDQFAQYITRYLKRVNK